MATPQNKRRGAPAGRKAPEAVNVRGLTDADLAAVDRAIARRLRAAAAAGVAGAQLSRNAVIVAVLRDALAREEAADASTEGP